MIARFLVLLLFLVGILGLLARRNLIKKVFALGIMNTAAVILFTMEGSAIGSAAPLLESGGAASGPPHVDPVPQALMLTAIVVGVCVTALALALAYRLYAEYGTLDSELLRGKVDHE
jgi:multicomponent Na+:H+ antiporter subunit C